MFSCAQCQKIFAESKNLEAHARAQNHKSYPCSKCTKRFTSRTARWKHEQTHLKPKSFPCESCKKVLSRKEHLGKHVRKYHNDTGTASQSEPHGIVIDLTNEIGLSSLVVNHPDTQIPETSVPALDLHVTPSMVADIPYSIPTPYTGSSSAEFDIIEMPDEDHHTNNESSHSLETSDHGMGSPPVGEMYRFNQKAQCYERKCQGVTDRFIFGDPSTLPLVTVNAAGNTIRTLQEPKIRSWYPYYYYSHKNTYGIDCFRIFGSDIDLSLLEGLNYWFKIGDWESGAMPVMKSTTGIFNHFSDVFFAIPPSRYPKERFRTSVLYRTSWNMEWRNAEIIASLELTSTGGVHYEYTND